MITKMMMNRRNMGMFTRAFLLMAAVACTTACSDDDDESPITGVDDTSVIKGSDLSSVAGVAVDSEAKTISVEIYKSGDWKLYEYNGTDAPDFTSPVLTGSTAGTYTLPAATYARYCLQWGESRTVIAPRKQPVEGQANFRDLGGYKTKEGKFVKWGLMFRSGNLASLTDADLTYLASVPLKTIVDFRTDSEKEEAPDRVPSSVKNVHEFTIESGDTAIDEFMIAIANGDWEWVKNTMTEANGFFVDVYKEVFSSYFAVAMDEANLPMVYHCTAGKDRAGFASAMFLSALGVDRETIFEDYLLTNTMTDIRYEDYAGSDMMLAVYYSSSVQREYLQNAFDTIEAQYESVENYLETVLGVDIKKMRSIYLY